MDNALAKITAAKLESADRYANTSVATGSGVQNLLDPAFIQAPRPSVTVHTDLENRILTIQKDATASTTARSSPSVNNASPQHPYNYSADGTVHAREKTYAN